MVKIRVRVSGHEKLGRLARRLRAAADGGLMRDVKAELERDSRPVLANTRAAVLRASFPVVPSKGGSGGTGFRGRLAAATRTETLGNGVRFTVDGAAAGPRGHRLAMLTDTELAPRWRHPVRGNRERWVTQLGQPWFFSSIRPEEPRYAAGVLRAMDKTARRIEG